VKLVRDKIPQIIIDSGRKVRYHVASESEHIFRLYEKMLEEMEEFRENPCVEEAADMLEVLNGLCHTHNISMVDVVNKAIAKRTERGPFDDGVVLEEVED
tara:strand:+ start:980 stop:1279 length:300 start_codon:yes stop_codon:yes gene_type:complete